MSRKGVTGRRGRSATASPARLHLRLREQRAVDWRLAGMSWKQIAEADDRAEDGEGWKDGTGARRGVLRLLEETAQEPADILRKISTERLDALLRAIWPQAMRGSLLAVDRVLKIEERRSQLMGLDAPQKRIVEIITPEALQEALEAKQVEAEQLRAQLNAAPDASDQIDYAALEADVERELAERRAQEAEVVDAEVVDAQ